jgi:hypothetical protein
MKDEDFYSMQYILEELGAFVLAVLAIFAVVVLIALVVKRFV